MQKRSSEKGNVFIFVILGVALFATLAFTISRSMRSETATDMSKREIELAVADILTYTQKLERAVSRLQRRSVSESDISFHASNWGHNNYEHAQPDKHKIFHPEGGAVSWRSPADGVNDGSPWLFTGETCIVNIGTGVAGCEGDTDSTNEELLAVLPRVTKGLCDELNRKLGIAGIPLNAGTGFSTQEFDGAFSDGATPDNMDGLSAGCFEGGGAQTGYHFYHVLIAR